MPEFPEVEPSKRGIQPHIQDKILTGFVVRNSQLRWPVPEAELQSLQGQRLLHVRRRAKYIILQFQHAAMLIHLGMSGSLRIVDANAELKKHDHIDAVFGDDCILRLNDPRRFGSWLFSVDPIDQHRLLQNLGPEPLSTDFCFEYFYQASRKKKQPVKQWLMDNKTVVGVGNIYASESLFKAGIRPSVQVGRVSRAKLQLLYDAVKLTLSQAIEQGGTTLRDFVGSDGKPGYFKQQLWVYGRAGQPCHRCGSVIKSQVMAQRNTFYCPSCQSR